MAGSSWFIWPPSRRFLEELYHDYRWTKGDIARVFQVSVDDIVRLIGTYGIGPRPERRMGKPQTKNTHGDDWYKAECPKCEARDQHIIDVHYDFKPVGERPKAGKRYHYLCPLLPDGCTYGSVRTVSHAWHGHLLDLRDGHQCFACEYDPREHLDDPWDKRHLEIQHILPRSKGGSNCLHNLVWLCTNCHRGLAKGRKYGGIPQRPITK